MIKLLLPEVKINYVSYNAPDDIIRENDIQEMAFIPTSEGVVIKFGPYGSGVIVDPRILVKTIEYLEYLIRNKPNCGLIRSIQEQPVETEGQ